MTYTHLTTDELVMIESYYHQNIPVTTISAHLKRSRTPIYNVIHFLKEGHTALDYYQQYKKNKKRFGRRKRVLPLEQETYIKEKVAQGWTPDVIIGRKETPIGCSMRTLYRRFKEKVFDETTLPMKGKRKPNGHQERLSKIIITLKPNGRKANDIENTMNQWFGLIPRHLFKSITFDCGK